MTELNTLIADMETAGLALVDTLNDWTPDDEFTALLMQSYSNPANTTVKTALQGKVFDAIYTDKTIEALRQLSLRSIQLSNDDYKRLLVSNTSSTSQALLAAAFQKKLMESLQVLMQET